MYLPAPFQTSDRALLVELMRAYPFATVVGVRDGAPEIAHLPVLVKDGVLEAHVAAKNPLLALVEQGAPLTAVFHGPHAYVSPRFYKTAPNVPTWNYVVVHASGPTRLLPDPMQHLREVTATFDSWQMDPDYARKLQPGMAAFELRVEKLEGKLKLNQNRKPEDWAAVVEHFAQSEDPGERAMVALMQRLGSP